MLALFCLRLAAGMMVCLLPLAPAVVPPRFYRTHFLTALGLCVVSLWLLWDGAVGLLWLLGVAAALSFVGSVLWWLEDAPGGSTLIGLTSAALVAGLLWGEAVLRPEGEPLAAAWVGGLTSAALLGAALSAMLMGHSYLIAPSMSLTPLRRLLLALGLALLLRMAADGYGLWRWTNAHDWRNLSYNTEGVLWLVVRWAVGLVLPVVLGWMAWESARIRSTQSATGILYVVVIFCFLGELTGQLLRAAPHHLAL
jgi:hypothetical protein